MGERVSRSRDRGSWNDGVAQGERLARAVRERDVDQGALAEGDDWRPEAPKDSTRK